MQSQGFDTAVFVAVILLAILAGAFVLRRLMQRRREQFGQVTPPEGLRVVQGEKGRRATGDTLEEDDATAQAHAAEDVAMPVASPEADLAPPEPRPAAPEDLAKPPPELDLVLRAGLKKTQEGFLARINALFARSPKVDGALLDSLEDVLLTSDVGVKLTMRLMDELRARQDLSGPESVQAALRTALLQVFAQHEAPTVPIDAVSTKPKVILFVGVNGVGKTTTIGKIASQLRDQKLRVLMAAGDTFRAAAAEQLEIWAERSGAALVRDKQGADPASVIFNAVQKAAQDGYDVVLADTAGRLHTKTELMDEIKKVRRAASKARDGAPDETFLVVDGTTGQNALQQAREFHDALGLSGIILTKLDGTAKGGVVVAVVDALGLPIRFVGVGEKAQDLRPFDAHAFIAALFDNAAAA